MWQIAVAVVAPLVLLVLLGYVWRQVGAAAWRVDRAWMRETGLLRRRGSR